MSLEKLGEHRCFGGVQGFYRHASRETRTPMRFAVYLPPQAAHRPVPHIYCLAGLTCTEENFTVKAGAQRVAAELGVALVMPDTSPRGVELPGDRDSYDFGVSAGFYVDATESPWSQHYRMYSYVVHELPAVVEAAFAVDPARRSILGHSMGGHGALTIALKHPDRYRAVSAFAPIAAPSQCPWGRKALTNYLGVDQRSWRAYDACALIADGHRVARMKVDQGLADPYLAEQLLTDHLVTACGAAGQPLDYAARDGYDHGYYYISTFIADHLAWHLA